MHTFSVEGKNISKEINHQAIIKNMSMNFPNNSIILIEHKLRTRSFANDY